MKTALLLFSAAALASAQADIRGFSASEAESERAREAKALAVPDAQKLRTYMERMSAEPHIAGSPQSKAVADYVAGLLREWGLEVKIEEFEALLPYPKSHSLEMTGPVKFTAKLSEPKISEDHDSGDKG